MRGPSDNPDEAADDAATSGRRRPSEAVILGGLLGLCAVVLLPILAFGFVYDDGWTITANGFLRQPADLPLLLSDEAARRHVPDAFRPTLVAFDVLAYQLLGLLAPAHHALSIALHLLVCWLGQRWLGILGAPLDLRAASVALFGLLALHAEAIAVISFREDLLAAALAFGGAIAASQALRANSARRRGGHALAAAGLMALAAAAKMSAAAAPILWWIAEAAAPWSDAPLPWRRRLAAAAPLAAGVALAIGHTLLTHGALSPYGGPGNLRLFANRVGVGPVLAESTVIHLGYLQQALLPFGLSPEYVDRGASWGDPAVLLASAALLALLAYGLGALRGRRRPLAALAILGALALALPTSNLAAMPNMRADRLMYLPSWPLCVGLGALLLALGRPLARALRSPSLAYLPLALMAILQGSVLQASAQVYRSNGAIWTVAARRAPDSARAQALLAEALLASREREESEGPETRRLVSAARAHCRRAEALDPLDELSHLCFARVAIARQEWATAEHRLRRALELSVDRSHRIIAALAEVTLDLPGRSEAERSARALEIIDAGLREYPYAVELWVAAGRLRHRVGDPTGADAALARAFALAPERWETSALTIEVALDRGDPARAIELLDERHRVLDAAAPGLRAALERRAWDHSRLFSPTSGGSLLLSDPSTGASLR
ncbi:MAG: hypothetical protein H6711_00995 [Myxococcales bacterium]|nr:hypothetical protein [Myxococcales bacterium]